MMSRSPVRPIRPGHVVVRWIPSAGAGTCPAVRPGTRTSSRPPLRTVGGGSDTRSFVPGDADGAPQPMDSNVSPRRSPLDESVRACRGSDASRRLATRPDRTSRGRGGASKSSHTMSGRSAPCRVGSESSDTAQNCSVVYIWATTSSRAVGCRVVSRRAAVNRSCRLRRCDGPKYRVGGWTLLLVYCSMVEERRRRSLPGQQPDPPARSRHHQQNIRSTPQGAAGGEEPAAFLNRHGIDSTSRSDRQALPGPEESRPEVASNIVLKPGTC